MSSKFHQFPIRIAIMFVARMVVILTGLRAGRSNLESRQGSGIVLLIRSRLAMGSSHPPVQWVPVLFPEGKRAGLRC
jgi:hypothetical protein